MLLEGGEPEVRKDSLWDATVVIRPSKEDVARLDVAMEDGFLPVVASYGGPTRISIIADFTMVEERHRVNEACCDREDDGLRDVLPFALAFLDEIVEVTSRTELEDHVRNSSREIINDVLASDDAGMIGFDLRHHVDLIWVKPSAIGSRAVAHLLDDEHLTRSLAFDKMDGAFIVSCKCFDNGIFAGEALGGGLKFGFC